MNASGCGAHPFRRRNLRLAFAACATPLLALAILAALRFSAGQCAARAIRNVMLMPVPRAFAMPRATPGGRVFAGVAAVGWRINVLFVQTRYLAGTFRPAPPLGQGQAGAAAKHARIRIYFTGRIHMGVIHFSPGFSRFAGIRLR